MPVDPWAEFEMDDAGPDVRFAGIDPNQIPIQDLYEAEMQVRYGSPDGGPPAPPKVDPWAEFDMDPPPPVGPKPELMAPWRRPSVAPAEAPPEEPGFFGNTTALIGEEIANLAGGFLGTASQIADWLDRNVGMGGLVFTEDGPKWASAEEYNKYREEGMSTPLSWASEGLKSVDFAENQYTTDKIKQQAADFDWSDPASYADMAGATMGFIMESGLQSLPHMVAVSLNLPGYVIARANQIGDKRAENDGRKGQATLADTVAAAPFAVASALFERIGAKGIAGAGKNITQDALNDAVQYGFKAAAKRIAKEGGKAGAKELGTEAIQEGVLEYIGEHYGTEAKMSVADAFERAGWGALAGGGFGAVAGGTVATAREIFRPMPKDTTDEDTGGVADDAASQAVNADFDLTAPTMDEADVIVEDPTGQLNFPFDTPLPEDRIQPTPTEPTPTPTPTPEDAGQMPLPLPGGRTQQQLEQDQADLLNTLQESLTQAHVAGDVENTQGAYAALVAAFGEDAALKAAQKADAVKANANKRQRFLEGKGFVPPTTPPTEPAPTPTRAPTPTTPAAPTVTAAPEVTTTPTEAAAETTTETGPVDEFTDLINDRRDAIADGARARARKTDTNEDRLDRIQKHYIALTRLRDQLKAAGVPASKMTDINVGIGSTSETSKWSGITQTNAKAKEGLVARALDAAVELKRQLDAGEITPETTTTETTTETTTTTAESKPVTGRAAASETLSMKEVTDDAELNRRIEARAEARGDLNEAKAQAEKTDLTVLKKHDAGLIKTATKKLTDLISEGESKRGEVAEYMADLVAKIGDAAMAVYVEAKRIAADRAYRKANAAIKEREAEIQAEIGTEQEQVQAEEQEVLSKVSNILGSDIPPAQKFMELLEMVTPEQKTELERRLKTKMQGFKVQAKYKALPLVDLANMAANGELIKKAAAYARQQVAGGPVSALAGSEAANIGGKFTGGAKEVSLEAMGEDLVSAEAQGGWEREFTEDYDYGGGVARGVKAGGRYEGRSSKTPKQASTVPSSMDEAYEERLRLEEEANKQRAAEEKRKKREALKAGKPTQEELDAQAEAYLNQGKTRRNVIRDAAKLALTRLSARSAADSRQKLYNEVANGKFGDLIREHFNLAGKVDAYDTMDVNELLTALISSFPTGIGSPIKLLLRSIRELDLPIRFIEFSLNPNEAASWSGDTGRYVNDPKQTKILVDTIRLPIRFDENGRLDVGSIVHDFIHEVAHSATVHAYDTNPEFKRKIDSLLNTARSELGKRGVVSHETAKLLGRDDGVYGLNDSYEFMAEALSNPFFQALLGGIEAPPSARTSSIRTTWQAFVSTFKRMMGMHGVEDSVLDHAIRAIAEGVRTGEQLQKLLDEGKIKPPLGERYNIPQTRKKVVEALRGTTEGRQWYNSARRIAMNFMTLDQLVRRYTPLIGKPVRAYADAVRRKVSEARKRQAEGEQLMLRLNKYSMTDPKKWKALNQLFISSTLNGYHPDLPLKSSDNAHLRSRGKTAEQRRADQMVHQQGKDIFNNTLDGEGRAIYRLMKRYFENQRKDLMDSALERLSNKWRISPAAMAILRTIKKDKELAEAEKTGGLVLPKGMDSKDKARVLSAVRKIVEMGTVPGPYFPLRRFGDFVLDVSKEEVGKEAFDKKEDAQNAARDATKGDKTIKYKVEKGIDDKWHYKLQRRVVSFYETQSEAEADAAQLTKNGFTPTSGPKAVTPKRESTLIRTPELAGLAGMLRSKMANEGGGDNVYTRTLDTALLELLAISSMKASELHRQGVEGVKAEEMPRALAAHIYGGSWAIADMKFGLAHEEALKGIDEIAKGTYQGNEVSDVRMYRAARLRDHLRKADEVAVRDRTFGKAESLFGQVGFYFYLSSLSYSTVNLTQPWIVGGPYLAARYGVAATTREMARLATAMVQPGYNSLKKERFGVKSDVDIGQMDKVLTKAVLRGSESGLAETIQQLTDLGVIDANFAAELYKQAQGIAMEGRVTKTLANTVRTLPQTVEVSNRILMAAAAYNLEMRKSKDVEKARTAAYEAVLQTQFDYSDINKPLAFKAIPGARTVTMFKMYAQGIYALWATNVFNLKDPSKRGEALKTMGWLTASHSLLAGIAGGLFEPLKGLISMIAGWWDDDDEFNFDIAIQNWTRDLSEDIFGSEFGNTIGEMLAKGAPRGLGFDMASRVGIDNVLFWSQSQVGDTLENWWADKLVQFAGPIYGGIPTKVLRGVDQIAAGEPLRGVGQMLPKGIADLFKAYRLHTRGVTTSKGEEIVGPEVFNKWDLAVQAFGWRTAKEAEMTEGYYAQRGYERAMNIGRTALLNEYRREGMTESLAKKLADWNEKHGQYPILNRHLIQARKSRQEQEMLNKYGLVGKKPAAWDYARFAIPE